MVNSTYADAAIGGPTLEMLVASWNAKYPTQKLQFGVNSTGYQIGKESGSLSIYVSVADYEGFDNSLYYPHNKSGNTSHWNSCHGYWLASPASYLYSSAMFAYRDGGIRYHDYNLAPNADVLIGVRPVVCLKSNVDLVLDDEGIWQLHTISLDKSEDQEKFVGDTFTLTATIYPHDATNKNINWTSSDPNVATISTNQTTSGTAITVTCIGEGSTTITATSDGNGKSVTLHLTVKSPRNYFKQLRRLCKLSSRFRNSK